MNLYGRLYRGLLFPAFDRLIKGRKTIRYWRELEESQWRDRSSLEAGQFESLKKLLVFAGKHCTFYRNQWEAKGLDPSKLQSLENYHRWPLLFRETVRIQSEQIRSTISMKRIMKSTGGSTGQPLSFEINTDSNERRTAMMFRGYDWAECGPGAKRMLIWGADLKPKARLHKWKIALHHRFDNQRILNCFEFSEETMLEKFNIIQKYRPQTIVAYTNPLYEFARFLKDRQLSPTGIQSIVVGAEKIHDFQRSLIEEVFQAKVFETYGSREFMLIGAECEQHKGLHLSMENLLVEVLQDDGTPTPAGVEGNVVITDLYNTAMPFIRYVNGDRAIAGFTECTCGRGLPMLTKIVGRRLDILRTGSGKVIPGEFFPHFFKDYPSIRRFQVHQHQMDAIEIQLVVEESQWDILRQQVTPRIQAIVGEKVQITLRNVSAIPLTASGKLQVVVNHCTNRF